MIQGRAMTNSISRRCVAQCIWTLQAGPSDTNVDKK
jgi:hypothetical protein